MLFNKRDMIQEKYQKAMKFAGVKHYSQTMLDGNANYLLHISNVAMEVLVAHHELEDFDLEYAIQLAILHDTLEDTNTTFEELEENFGIEVAEGVKALTKDESLPDKSSMMLDSLARIQALDKEVAIVKLADRITNLQEPPMHWVNEKKLAYRKEAQLILETLNGKNDYLSIRLQHKIDEYRSYCFEQ